MKRQFTLNSEFETYFPPPSNQYQSGVPLIAGQWAVTCPLCILTLPSYLLHISKAQFNSQQVTVWGRITYQNGMPFVVPKVYSNLFEQLPKASNSQLQFMGKNDGNQLVLKYVSKISLNKEISDYFNQFGIEFMESKTKLDQCLQSIGLIAKFNKFAQRVKKQQIKLKKTIVQQIRANRQQLQFPSAFSQPKHLSCTRNVQSIHPLSQSFSDSKLVYQSSAFKIQSMPTSIKFQQTLSQKVLALKTVNSNSQHKEFFQSKIQNEQSIVKRIINPSHFLTYYFPPLQQNVLYMDYVPLTLKSAISSHRFSSQQLIDLASQLITAVNVLHCSQVVHRDLKPENIVIEGSTLKIIDFAQSVSLNQRDKYRNGLGYTLPYSPFECVSKCEEGISRKQIDLWSIILIMYEMVFSSLPFFYSRYIGDDIVEKWRMQNSEFSIYANCRKKRGMKITEQIMGILAIRGIQQEQSKRLSLQTLGNIVSGVKTFHQYFYKNSN